MVHKYFIFFYFIFFISFASSTTLTMGPQQLDFIGEHGDVICQTATLKLEGSDVVIGNVRFSEDGYSERKLTKHNLSAEDVGLEIAFPKEILIENKSNIEICVDGKVGNYHGIILYKIKDKPIQVGIWLNVSLSRGSKNDLMKITGNAVSGEDGISGLIITPAILLLVLGLLYWRLKRDGEGEVYDY